MRSSSFVSLGLVIVAIGCGGATETGLFGTDDGTSTDAGHATDGNGSTNHDGGSSTTVDGGTTGRDGGTTKDSGTTGFDAGTSDLTVPCGESMGTEITCNVGAQYCCATNINTGTPNYSCQSTGTSTCTGLRLPCNGTDDCHGAICCGKFDQVAGYTEVACKATCVASGATGTAVHFCDPNAVVDECAPSSTTCQASQALPGYYLCK